MSIASDLKVLYHLAFKPVRGDSHAQRMESFYSGQADDYDAFRKRLLKGRAEMYAQIQPPDQAIWVDLGGGTGANLEYLGERVSRLKHAYVVDLSESLLEIAGQRAQANGWNQVIPVAADATTFRPEQAQADVVTCSYSLTMIPDWFAAIDNAYEMLKPGGQIGVVDFYVARKYPTESQRRHGWMTRTGWPAWFQMDNVFPSADHLPYLQNRFQTVSLQEMRAKVPYLPLVRAPYYIFVGQKPG